MLLKVFFLIFFCSSSLCLASDNNRSINFGKSYLVKGVLSLPYAELREPFTAFYDELNSRSRIDYYGDFVLTYQRGDIHNKGVNGVSYKVIYSVDKNGNPKRACFKLNGNDVSPIKPQVAIPDLSSFEYKSLEECPQQEGSSSGKCELWKYVNVVNEKENEYKFWLKRDSNSNPIPVFYSMFGYNSLFGSHYDRYDVEYHTYQPAKFENSTFDVGYNLTCTDYPGPGSQNIALHNPMKEFMEESAREEHIDRQFNRFQRKHKKRYENKSEEERRKTFFRHNHRYIESSNRKNVYYKMKVNKFSDLNDKERAYLRGRKRSYGYNGGAPFVTIPDEKLPESWDWRLYGAVTQVQDQAVCGSCWSFGTTGTIEGVNFVKTGHLLKFSEQQLIDCSWNKGNNGCDGGEDFRSYNYIMERGGLSLEEDYGYYIGQDGKCHENSVPKAVQLSGFVNVTANDPDALKLALIKHGPVTISIDASPKSFSFYSHGVYNDKNCQNSIDSLDHQVLLVGYGKVLGKEYWLIKNSWSTYWGNDGYILIDIKDNICGVTDDATFPVIK